jgi:bacteriorhodopsin
MAQPGPEQLWLWIGTAGMTLGTLAFIGMGWGEDDTDKQEFYVITIFISAIAAVSYFSMAIGFGLIEVTVAGMSQPLDIYWARYAD